MLEIGKIERIETQIGFIFTDKNKLVQVFTTKSYAKEQNDLGINCKSQEEYRTQGDSILKNVLIELLKKMDTKLHKKFLKQKATLRME
jgi:ribonuclease III